MPLNIKVTKYAPISMGLLDKLKELVTASGMTEEEWLSMTMERVIKDEWLMLEDLKRVKEARKAIAEKEGQ